MSCLRCGSLFAVGAERCPQCWSEDFEEADVPKITVAGGATHPEDLAAVSGLPGVVPSAAAGPVESEAPALAAEVVTEPAPAPESEPEPVAEPEPAPKAKAAPSLSGPAKAS